MPVSGISVALAASSGEALRGFGILFLSGGALLGVRWYLWDKGYNQRLIAKWRRRATPSAANTFESTMVRSRQRIYRVSTLCLVIGVVLLIAGFVLR